MIHQNSGKMSLLSKSIQESAGSTGRGSAGPEGGQRTDRVRTEDGQRTDGGWTEDGQRTDSWPRTLNNCAV